MWDLLTASSSASQFKHSLVEGFHVMEARPTMHHQLSQPRPALPNSNLYLIIPHFLVPSYLCQQSIVIGQSIDMFDVFIY